MPLRGFIVLMPIIINRGWQSMYIITDTHKHKYKHTYTHTLTHTLDM